jgi:hypothetical protein
MVWTKQFGKLDFGWKVARPAGAFLGEFNGQNWFLRDPTDWYS